MLGQLLTLAASLLLLAPWAALGCVLLDTGRLSERLVVGAAIGLGATVSCAYVLAAFHHLDMFAGVFAAISLCAAIVVVRRRAGASASTQRLADSNTRWLVAALAVVVGFALAPTLGSRPPIGLDPAFHAILAEKVRLANGLVYDWQPFEAIPLNYPLGSHIWVVLNAQLSREAVHHVFQVEHLVLQTLAAWLVFAVSLRVFDCFRSALFALLTYGVLGNWGTFYSYYQWGGLPTELSFVLFLALVWCAFTLQGWRAHVLGALLFGSILLVHHLSAAIAAIVLGGYCLLAIGARTRDGLWQRFAWSLLLAALAYAAFIIPYAMRARHLQGTEVLHFEEEPRLSLFTLVDNLGAFVVVCGALGLWRARGTRGPNLSFLFAWTMLLLFGYFALDYGYRLGALLLTGRDYTAFTPSRLATVLSYPLCIAAGYSVEAARAWLAARAAARNLRLLAQENSSMALLVSIAVLAAWPRAIKLSERIAYEPPAEPAGAWLREHTPNNAFIVHKSLIAPEPWLAFLTWRACEFAPIPASEDRGAVARKYREITAHPTEISRRLARLGKSTWVFSIGPDGAPNLVALP